MANYNWTGSQKYCSTEIHLTQPTCPDCDTNQACQGCGGTIPAGQPHRICKQNGEAAHQGCEGKAAKKWALAGGNW